jgi:hypothetical protein
MLRHPFGGKRLVSQHRCVEPEQSADRLSAHCRDDGDHGLGQILAVVASSGVQEGTFAHFSEVMSESSGVGTSTRSD